MDCEELYLFTGLGIGTQQPSHTRKETSVRTNLLQYQFGLKSSLNQFIYFKSDLFVANYDLTWFSQAISYHSDSVHKLISCALQTVKTVKQ